MKIFALASLAGCFVLSGCGTFSSSESDAHGLPTKDAEAGRMRWHFKQGFVIQDYHDIENTKWHCVQRSAIKGAFHTSYFTRKFLARVPGMLHSTATFESVPTAESKMILTRSWNTSLSGSSRGIQTDRYQFYPDQEVSVFIRVLTQRVLMEEWAVLPQVLPLARIINGKSIIAPELTGQPRQLMESAYSRPTMLAFMYASCTNAEYIDVNKEK